MQIKIEKIVSGNRKIAPKNDFSHFLHLLPIGKVAATSWSCRVNFYDSFTTHLRLIYDSITSSHFLKTSVWLFKREVWGDAEKVGIGQFG